MDTLALKLAVTPILIGAASLAGRRWGEGVSGSLVALPLTSGPIVFFLALDHGVAFAAAAAVGSLAGAIAQAAFCLAYGWLAPRRHWLLALLAGGLAFATASAVLQPLALSLALLLLSVIAALAIAFRLMPRGSDGSRASATPPWDIPARMVVTTALVVLLTSLAPALGPRFAGLLATFPLYAAILAVFAHRQDGPDPATRVLRGLLLGLFAFAGFFGVLGALIERVGVTASFAAAIAVALALQGGSLRFLRRDPRRAARRHPLA